MPTQTLAAYLPMTLQGVAKALFEHRMLRRVLAGSSVGSIIAGILATRTDSELCELFERLDVSDIAFFNNARAVELVHSWIQRGGQTGLFETRRSRLAMAVESMCAVVPSTGHGIKRILHEAHEHGTTELHRQF